MKRLFLSIAGLIVVGCATPQTATQAPAPEDASIPGCPPPGWTRERLEALKAAAFEIAEPREREAFAKAITACLASSDPSMRDGVAFEALTHMLRGRQLSVEAMRGLLADLATRLSVEDPRGFGSSFAALALAEVARADRVEAFLSEGELEKLLADAQHWFVNIGDYRGFSDVEGWRHAVAHGSDLLMQLSLNPRIDREGLRLIVSAVGVQVAPEAHAYVHGESERLARPVLFAAARGVMSEGEWSEWLMAVATPKDAGAVYASEQGLNWRHNAGAFLQALYVNVVIGSDAADDVMKPGLEAALKALP